MGFRSNPLFLLLLLLLPLFLFVSYSHGSSQLHSLKPTHIPEVDVGRENGGLVGFNERRSVVENVNNSSMILAEKRATRKDPTNDFKYYTGGWNISNGHYWASVAFTAVPLFVVAAFWFVVFGICLFFILLCCCCCRREPYGYSRLAYALSLIFLIFFTVAAIAGCVVLYTGQGKFHGKTTNTLGYVVNQADVIVVNLKNISGYLSAAKQIGVDSVFLSSDVTAKIDNLETKINSSASTLAKTTKDNSENIQNALDSVTLALVIVAAVMLFLVFLGFLFSIFGLRGLVYFLVIIGWILVAGTFILCGIFLLLHNVVADTCVAMDEWVKYPMAQTALDDILPCVDNATAQETLLRTKDVSYQLVNVVNGIIRNVSNVNVPPNFGPLYFNQSGPLMPVLCNPLNSDFTDRQCAPGEVDYTNSTQVWKNYVCKASASGICTTPGRVTPSIYNQMTAAVNVSYGLYHYGPFLVNLEDCTFARDTFTSISGVYCPGLRRYSQWIYIGLVMVSAAVMLSLIFWVIYARERRHRVYTKQFINSAPNGGHLDRDKAP